MTASRVILGNTPAPESVNEHSGCNPGLYGARDRSFNGLGSAAEVFWQHGGCRLIEHIIVEIRFIGDFAPLNSTQLARYAMELAAEALSVQLIFDCPGKRPVMGITILSG